MLGGNKKEKKKRLATVWLLLELNITFSRGKERQQNITGLLISLYLYPNALLWQVLRKQIGRRTTFSKEPVSQKSQGNALKSKWDKEYIFLDWQK